MSKSINLIYSKNSLGFFSNISKAKSQAEAFYKEPNCFEFNEKDHDEINRGDSYAFFDDLKALVQTDQELSIDNFKESLKQQGITDENFQNRVLWLILQSKIGIHFSIPRIVDQLFLNKDYYLYLKNPKVSLDINHKDELILNFSGTLTNPDNHESLSSFNSRLVITPEMVTISDFSFIKISDSKIAEDFFQFLEDNQHHFLQRLWLWIKRFFGFNAELRLEESPKIGPTL
jgi:hypothetical protein